MNKKFYIIPEAEILEIETQGFLAASLGNDGDDTILNGGDDNGEGGEHFNPDLY